MSALANKKYSFKDFLSELKQAFNELISNEEYDEDQTIENAINETIAENPDMENDLNKFRKIYDVDKKVLDEMVEKQFSTENTFGKNIKNSNFDDIKVNTDININSTEINSRNEKNFKELQEKTRMD